MTISVLWYMELDIGNPNYFCDIVDLSHGAILERSSHILLHSVVSLSWLQGLNTQQVHILQP